MTETLVSPNNVECSGVLLAQTKQDGDLDLSLARVRRVVLEYLDRYHIIAAVSPAFYHLTKRALAQKLQHLQATARCSLSSSIYINL